ncbi:hypothetical protein E2C01_035161 [Portunus trituberculatus]|uniref:Uncharacterized protein n=1 Tax=Portunus trituberculatus TaxID=210409 RepID=A0A5B7F4Y8_PORTR|nr:hypothetical protein [Portunus trituberculatus]
MGKFLASARPTTSNSSATAALDFDLYPQKRLRSLGILFLLICVHVIVDFQVLQKRKDRRGVRSGSGQATTEGRTKPARPNSLTCGRILTSCTGRRSASLHPPRRKRTLPSTSSALH